MIFSLQNKKIQSKYLIEKGSKVDLKNNKIK